MWDWFQNSENPKFYKKQVSGLSRSTDNVDTTICTTEFSETTNSVNTAGGKTTTDTMLNVNLEAGVVWNWIVTAVSTDSMHAVTCAHSHCPCIVSFYFYSFCKLLCKLMNRNDRYGNTPSHLVRALQWETGQSPNGKCQEGNLIMSIWLIKPNCAIEVKWCKVSTFASFLFFS